MEKEINLEDINKNHQDKLNINLLDTIENKDLFKNLLIKDNNIYSQTNNKTINNHILNENKNQIQSDINNLTQNKENQINIKTNNDAKISEESNNDNKINYISFKDFMSKKKNKNISKSVSVTKKKFSIKNNNIQKDETHKKRKKYSKSNKSKKKDNDIKEEKIEKKKYSKERMEINQQRLNNLYNDYKKILNKRENKKKELYEEEIKDFSFSPKINKYSKLLIQNNSHYSKPIFLRNNDKKDFYKKKHEINFTHIPKINKNSKYNNLDVYNRLYNKNKINNKTHKNMDDIPFRPITNYNFKYQKCNNIPFQNILKRQLLLDEYINQHKIDINNNNQELIKLSYTPNTSCTSNSKYSIKPENQRLFMPYFNKISGIISKMKINKKPKRNHTLNNVSDCILNENKNKINIKNNYSENENDILDNNNSYYLNHINNQNSFNNKNIQLEGIPFKSLNTIKKNVYRKHEKTVIKSNHIKENTVSNYLNKINLRTYKSSNNGICINISENCKNIKNIINKNINNINKYFE